MGYFEYYQARQGKGYSEVKKPMYDKRIWNDEGSFVKSPTIKSTVNMGVSIAAMGLGPWAAMAVNLADDAVFSALDVAGGYKSGDQALFDFGKQAIASVATTAIGQFGGSIMGKAADAINKTPATGLMAMTGMGGVVARTAFTGLQSVVTSTASSAINAFELGKDGSLPGTITPSSRERSGKARCRVTSQAWRAASRLAPLIPSFVVLWEKPIPAA